MTNYLRNRKNGFAGFFSADVGARFPIDASFLVNKAETLKRQVSVPLIDVSVAVHFRSNLPKDHSLQVFDIKRAGTARKPSVALAERPVEPRRGAGTRLDRTGEAYHALRGELIDIADQIKDVHLWSVESLAIAEATTHKNRVEYAGYCCAPRRGRAQASRPSRARRYSCARTRTPSLAQARYIENRQVTQ